MAKLSAREKMCREKSPKKVRLEYDFAGIKAGQMMFVGTPQIIDTYIRSIPYGETRSIIALRRELARKRQCDASCPVSTSIFIRMSAEAAIEEMEDGVALDSISPFWRVLTSADKITKKLEVDPEWVDQQRALEAT